MKKLGLILFMLGLHAQAGNSNAACGAMDNTMINNNSNPSSGVKVLQGAKPNTKLPSGPVQK